MNTSNINEKLINSLKELLNVNTYENIKIMDICENARLPRSAFYYNFNNKNELLKYGAKQIIGELTEEVTKINPQNLEEYNESLRDMLIEFFENNKIIFSTFFKVNEDTSSLKIIFNMICEDLKERLNEREKEGVKFTIPPELVAEYYIGGYVNLFEVWMRNINDYNENQIKEIINTFDYTNLIVK